MILSEPKRKLKQFRTNVYTCLECRRTSRVKNLLMKLMIPSVKLRKIFEQNGLPSVA